MQYVLKVLKDYVTLPMDAKDDYDDDPYKDMSLADAEKARATLNADQERVTSVIDVLKDQLEKMRAEMMKVSQEQQKIRTSAHALDRRIRFLRFDNGTDDESRAIYHERLRTLFKCRSMQLNTRYDEHLKFRIRPKAELDEIVFVLGSDHEDPADRVYIDEVKEKVVRSTGAFTERENGDLIKHGVIVANIITDDPADLMQYL